jgi:hypothetical protein
MFTIASLLVFGVGLAIVIGSANRSAERTTQLLRELGNKWGLEYEPSSTFGCPQLRGVYRSHHVLFQVWPCADERKIEERKRLIVGLDVPFDGMIRICRKNGSFHLDVLGMKPFKTGDSGFDSEFLVSTTHKELTKVLLSEAVRRALSVIHYNEVCISSNQVRIYGTGSSVDESELARWVEAATEIDGRMKEILDSETEGS